jgi:hypothetical protein
MEITTVTLSDCLGEYGAFQPGFVLLYPWMFGLSKIAAVAVAWAWICSQLPSMAASKFSTAERIISSFTLAVRNVAAMPLPALGTPLLAVMVRVVLAGDPGDVADATIESADDQ